MPRYQITEKVGPWINDAIKEHGQGEDIAWEPALMPAKDGGALFTCFFWLPGALAGTVALGSFVIVNPLAVTEKEVNDTVRDFLGALREARSRDLAAQTPVPAAAAPAGPLPPGMTPSGLFLPGR